MEKKNRSDGRKPARDREKGGRKQEKREIHPEIVKVECDNLILCRELIRKTAELTANFPEFFRGTLLKLNQLTKIKEQTLRDFLDSPNMNISDDERKRIVELLSKE